MHSVKHEVKYSNGTFEIPMPEEERDRRDETNTRVGFTVHSRGETIYRNIVILQYLLLQYNTIWPIENINILHIAIYCNILLDIVLFVAD